MKRIEFAEERAKRYHRAMSLVPAARLSELENLRIKELSKRSRPVLLDLGAGDGFVSMYLSQSFPKATIYAIDSSKHIMKYAPNGMNALIADSAKLPLPDNSVDAIVSLASFHHVKEKFGTFQEISRILAPSGRCVIGDVMDGTSTQRFFDEVVRAHCITGHDHKFLGTEEVKSYASKNNMICVRSQVFETPWKFNSKEQMIFFVKNLLGLDIENSVLYSRLCKYFPIVRNENVSLGWQLGYNYMVKNSGGQQ